MMRQEQQERSYINRALQKDNDGPLVLKRPVFAPSCPLAAHEADFRLYSSAGMGTKPHNRLNFVAAFLLILPTPYESIELAQMALCLAL